jgi:Circularly permutated YpsA SLOG family
MDRMPKRIISGCRTNIERSALDWAMENHIPHGGWCPKGRRSEDGRIPKKYLLQEMKSSDYHPQSLRNVLDSDGTAMITLMPVLSRDHLLTRRLAANHGKPWIHIHMGLPDAGERLRAFIDEHSVTILNIVGVHEPQSANTDDAVRAVLSELYESVVCV